MKRRISAWMFLLAAFCASARCEDMKGKIGIGPGGALLDGFTPALGVRYWFTDRFALDGHAGWQGNNDASGQTSLGATAVWTLKERGQFRLLALAGVNADSYRFSGAAIQTVYTAGLGLGGEYAFASAPNLSLGVDLGGLRVSWTRNETAGGTDGGRNNLLGGLPRVGLSLRYYLN